MLVRRFYERISMKNNSVFLVCLIGGIYSNINASEKVKANKKEKAVKVISARILAAKQAVDAHDAAYAIVLSEGFDAAGSYVKRTYNPGFERRVCVRSADGAVTIFRR